MNWRELQDLALTEKMLERREDERDRRITKTLTGCRKPPDQDIVKKLKEKYNEKFYGKM